MGNFTNDIPIICLRPDQHNVPLIVTSLPLRCRCSDLGRAIVKTEIGKRQIFWWAQIYKESLGICSTLVVQQQRSLVSVYNIYCKCQTLVTLSCLIYEWGKKWVSSRRKPIKRSIKIFELFTCFSKAGHKILFKPLPHTSHRLGGPSGTLITGQLGPGGDLSSSIRALGMEISRYQDIEIKISCWSIGALWLDISGYQDLDLDFLFLY